MSDTPLTMTSMIALSLQRGLLDRALPEIRAVGFGYDDKIIDVYCAVEGEPNELLVDELESAATEVISDFPPGQNMSIKTRIERVDPSKRYDGRDPRIARWVYARYEEK